MAIVEGFITPRHCIRAHILCRFPSLIPSLNPYLFIAYSFKQRNYYRRQKMFYKEIDHACSGVKIDIYLIENALNHCLNIGEILYAQKNISQCNC